MRTRLKRSTPTTMTNTVDPAKTSGKTWGYSGVPGKGGETLNAVIIPKDDSKETQEDNRD